SSFIDPPPYPSPRRGRGTLFRVRLRVLTPPTLSIRVKHTREDGVHVLEVALEAEHLGDLAVFEYGPDLRVFGDALSEVPLGLPGLHGVTLDDPVGVLAGHPPGGQLEEELAGED